MRGIHSKNKKQKTKTKTSRYHHHSYNYQNRNVAVDRSLGVYNNSRLYYDQNISGWYRPANRISTVWRRATDSRTVSERLYALFSIPQWFSSELPVAKSCIRYPPTATSHRELVSTIRPGHRHSRRVVLVNKRATLVNIS